MTNSSQDMGALRTAFQILKAVPFFALLATQTSFAAICSGKDLKAVSDILSERHSKPLSSGAVPELYQYLDGIFDALAKEQAKVSAEFLAKGTLSKSLKELRSCLVIVDSIEKNAFVMELRSANGKPGHYGVAITTGLLDDLLYTNKSVPRQVANAEQIQKRVARVFSHELAHPLQSYQDPKYPRTNRDKLVYSQSSEFFADHLAIELSERAKLPRDSVYEALSTIFWSENTSNSTGLISSAISSHPHDSARLSSLRDRLTQLNFDSGDPRFAKNFRLPSKNALVELEKHLEFPFRFPSTLKEVRESANQIVKLFDGPKANETLSNRLRKHLSITRNCALLNCLKTKC